MQRYCVRTHVRYGISTKGPTARDLGKVLSAVKETNPELELEVRLFGKETEKNYLELIDTPVALEDSTKESDFSLFDAGEVSELSASLELGKKLGIPIVDTPLIKGVEQASFDHKGSYVAFKGTDFQGVTVYQKNPVSFNFLYAELITGLLAGGVTALGGALYNITQTIKNQPTMGGLTVVGVGIMAAGVIDAIRRLRTGEKRSLLTVIETHSEQAYEKIRNIAAKIEETD